MQIRRTIQRKGAIAVLIAFLLIPLLSLMACAVDLGWITHTQNQLQSAADSAALAGCGHLTDYYVRYYMPAQTDNQKQSILNTAKSEVTAAAIEYAGYNRAGDVASLKLLSADIELGYTSPAGAYTALPTYKEFPNTVKVTTRRDRNANNPLGLFFARVFGFNTISLTATATVTLYSGQIDGFNVPTNTPSRILPMTYDINHWRSFLKTGYGPDSSSVDRSANGDPQLTIYPSIKFKGNFGELSLNQSTNGASEIRDWIENGVSEFDLEANRVKGLLPLSQHNSNSYPDWKGNPGLKTSTIQEVGVYVGEEYLLPLFKPYNANPNSYAAGVGQGTNYYYTIVEFVGIKITAVDSKGNDKAIKVQPTSVIDPNALYTNIKPISPPTSTSYLQTTIVGPKLVK